MSPHSQLIQTLVDNIHEQMSFIQKALQKLPNDMVWYQVNENTNSVGILCQHLCGNLKQYVLSGLGGTMDTRQRDNEFYSKEAKSKAEVIRELQHVINDVVITIKSLSSAQMQNKHHIQGIELDTLEVVLHISHHLAYHTGQIVFITKMINNEQLDLFEGRDLNLKNA